MQYRKADNVLNDPIHIDYSFTMSYIQIIILCAIYPLQISTSGPITCFVRALEMRGTLLKCYLYVQEMPCCSSLLPVFYLSLVSADQRIYYMNHCYVV